MPKSTVNPMATVHEPSSQMCVFCGGKEPPILSATGHSYPMGNRCYGKAIKRDVQWNEDTPLKTLKSLLFK